MKKVVFLTPSAVEYGFGLAGVAQFTAAGGEAEERLRELTASSDTGLVIIDERMIGDIGEDKMREMETRWQGILLVLPAPAKPEAEADDYAARLIRRAIGYHVRLNP